MDYEKLYYNLINTRKGRVLDEMNYYEKHHIVPKCLGGRRTMSNLVYLTYREHFIAHKLLFLFTSGKDKVKMGYALHRLCTINNGTQKYRIKSSREFEKIKIKVYEFIKGEHHPCFGVKRPEEFCKKMSKIMKGSKNHRYGKIPWNKGLTKETDERVKKIIEGMSKTFTGRKLSQSHRKSLSEAMKGKNTYIKSEEHKEKISRTLSGRKLPKEVCNKMSLSRKGVPQKKVICPYCGKIGGTTMYRWHFDNCKYKGDKIDEC